MKSKLKEKVEKILKSHKFSYVESYDGDVPKEILSLIKKEILKGMPKEKGYFQTVTANTKHEYMAGIHAGWDNALKEVRDYIKSLE